MAEHFDVFEWFREGGWSMYLLLLVGFAAVPGALVHAVVARPASAVLAGAALAVVLVVGAFGTWQGRSTVERAVAFVDPLYREEIRVVGYEEASHPIKLAALLVAAGLPLLAIGELRRLRSGRRGHDGSAAAPDTAP